MKNFASKARAAAWAVSLLSVLVVFFPKQVRAIESFTECKFSSFQVFDVQWNISDGNLNISGITKPYDSSFEQPELESGDYFQFFESQTNQGTYGLNLFNGDGSLQQVMHQTGTFTALGEDFIFYQGSGFFGTVITTTQGLAYGSSASLPISQQDPTNEQISSFSSCISTPIEQVGPASEETEEDTTNGDDPTETSLPTNTNSTLIPIENAGFETGSLIGWEIGSQNGSLGSSITGNGTGVSVFNGSLAFSHGSHGSIGSPVLSDGSPNPYYAPEVPSGSWTFSPKNSTYAALLQPKNQQTFDQAVQELGISSSEISDLKQKLTTQAQVSGFGGGNPTDAAWITREVQLTAGKTYVMSWNYLATDYVPFNDGSITSLVSVSAPSNATITVNNSVGSYALLGFTNPGTGDYSTNSYGSTGWQISTYKVSVTGTYKLGFAVFNLDDTALSPVLMVDNAVGTTERCIPAGSNCESFGGVAPNNENAPSVVTDENEPDQTETTTTTTAPSTTTTAPAVQPQPSPEAQPQPSSEQEEVGTPVEQEPSTPSTTPKKTTVESGEQTETQNTNPKPTEETASSDPTETTVPMQDPIKEENPTENIETIIYGLETLSPEELSSAIDKLLAEGISEEIVIAVISSPEILHYLSKEQAAEIFSAVNVSELTEEQAAAIVAAIQEAPTEVKQSFESEINIYEGKFDNYVPLGSTVDVGTRRAIIAVNLVAASVATAATGMSTRGSSSGSGSTARSSSSDFAARKEEEEEEAGEIAGDGLEWIKAISIYKTINNEKTINWSAFMRKFLYSLMNLGFTLAGAVVLFYTLSGITRTIAMWSFGLAFVAAMYLAMKEPEDR